MPNKNYIRGRAFEYSVMHDLQSEGYTCYRTAGSHGAYDVIAFKPTEILLIQCKTKLTKRANEHLVKTQEDMTVGTVTICKERWTKYILRRKKHV